MTNHDIHHPAARLEAARNTLLAEFTHMPADEFMRRHSRLFDAYFRQCCDEDRVRAVLDIHRNPYAVAALGGYGRREQNVHSDVDVLLLFDAAVPRRAETLVQEIIYPLWDIGIDVGHATRSLTQCLTMAWRRMDLVIPLLDARFVSGDPALFSRLMEIFHKRLLGERRREILAWLAETNARRHLRFGDSSYRLEPNLKEGLGGLRDYHTMLWIGKIKLGLQQARDFEYAGHLSHDEYRLFRRALVFIWDVRNRLHRRCGRKCDQLYFQSQINVARSMDFRPLGGRKPVERFLAHLHAQMDFIKQQHFMFLQQYDPRGKKTARRARRTRFDEIVVAADALRFDVAESIMKHPALLMHIFGESARLKIPLHPEAKRIIREFGHLMKTPLIADPAVVKAFEAVLKEPAPTFNVLREMLNTGFLQRLVPEFREIVHRIQYNAYHIYPVDKHVLRTVQTLKKLGTAISPVSCPLANGLWKNLKQRRQLLWAALLHDIGKGFPSASHAATGADITRTVLKRFHYPEKDIDLIAFLVRNHLMLIKTATRRDIHEEETAIHCARRIKNRQRLNMLYLLTIADSLSTGPKAWNEWTAALLRDLFLKVANIMQHGELVSHRAVRHTENKKKAVLNAAATAAEKKRVGAILPLLSPRYLISTDAPDITTDIDLYHQLGTGSFVWKITRDTATGTRTVKICARDQPGLFAKIAGTFTLNHLNILSAQIFTWRNNIALDIFDVHPPPDVIFEKEKWETARRHLAAALDGALDLGAALRNKMPSPARIKPIASKNPHRIVVDNHSSSFFSIVEVFTYDFPGVLFSITSALFEAGLDIWVAKISTRIDQVVDVFYVRDFDGQKMDDEKSAAALQAAILARLPDIE